MCTGSLLKDYAGGEGRGRLTDRPRGVKGGEQEKVDTKYSDYQCVNKKSPIYQCVKTKGSLSQRVNITLCNTHGQQ